MVRQLRSLLMVVVIISLLQGWSAAQVPPSFILSLDWHPDGLYIARAFGDGKVDVIHANNGNVAFSFVGQESARSVAWSPDGTQLAAGIGSQVYLWNWPAQQPLFVLEGHITEVISIAWNPTDGSEIATLSLEAAFPNLIFYNVNTGATRLEAGLSHCNDIVWSNDEDHLLAPIGGVVRRVNVQNGQPEFLSVRSLFPVVGLAAALNPDKTRIAIAFNGSVNIYDASTGDPLTSLEMGSNSFIRDIAWNSNDIYLAAIDDLGRVIIWDTRNAVQTLLLQFPSSIMAALDWHPGENRLVYSGPSGSTGFVTLPASPTRLTPTPRPR